MRNLRVYSKWPIVHDEFEIVLGFRQRGKRGTDNSKIWNDYEFGILNVSQTVVKPDDKSPQDRYLVRGIDSKVFETMDYTPYTWMETAQPNVRTEAIIYCYERLKQKK